MPANLSSFVRPTTVTIFANDPVNQAKTLAFILGDITNLDTSKQHVSMDYTRSIVSDSTYTVTRSPVEKVYADNIVRNPERLTVQAILSANPIGRGIAANATAQTGAFGSVVRLDLEKLKILKDLAKAREPVFVVTPVKGYNNMAITGIRETHTGANQVELSMSFEEVQVLSPILKPTIFDAAEVGSYAIENRGIQFPTPQQ